MRTVFLFMPGPDAFVSRPAFEHIAQDYLREQGVGSTVGSGWGKVPTGEGRLTETREVDAVALRDDGSVAALGSCKWTADPMTVAEEDLLARRQPAAPGRRAPRTLPPGRPGRAARVTRRRLQGRVDSTAATGSTAAARAGA